MDATPPCTVEVSTINVENNSRVRSPKCFGPLVMHEILSLKRPNKYSYFLKFVSILFVFTSVDPFKTGELRLEATCYVYVFWLRNVVLKVPTERALCVPNAASPRQRLSGGTNVDHWPQARPIQALCAIALKNMFSPQRTYFVVFFFFFFCVCFSN